MAYPATITLEAPEKIDNWRPLAQWLMALPHLILANVLSTVGQVVGVISWFVILFTGKLPEGLATFQCMILRYEARAYSYAGFLHAEYPPFDFATTAADPGGQPIRIDFEPALDNRNRLTVGLRIIWVIPAMLFTMVIWLAAFILWFVAWFAVLFTGRWPQGIHNFIMGALRVGTRTNAYFWMLTDEYPAFSTD
jgi:hypothetical protein